MRELSCINLSTSQFEDAPFPHFCCSSALKSSIEVPLFDWFESTKEWSLTEADFYKQYEFVLSETILPENLKCLVSLNTTGTIQAAIKKAFNLKHLNLVSIVAHKLVNGHKIGIHNDYINGEETHRLVIHINPNWDAVHGGYLMLFSSYKPEDVSKVIQPVNNSAFAFEISNKSYHAVSTIHNFSRYSIVYTFKGN